MKRIITATAAILLIAAACTESAAPPRREPFTGTVTLLAPNAGALFTQNDTTIGCPAHPARGSGFRLQFDWQDVPGATRYAIHLKADSARYPVLNQDVSRSDVDFSMCNAFVIDRNLDGWLWRVAAIRDVAGSTVPDTLWSEERRYGFTPCRLANGAPCYAPPDTTP